MTTSKPNIQIEPGLRPAHALSAACGFWEAFSGKLGPVLGPDEKALRFIESVMDPSHAISAVSETGKFLGVAGFKTETGAFIGGSMTDLAKVYGWIGAGWRGMALSLLERNSAPDTLLMDGIFVSRDARGLGVGTALLEAVTAKAASLGLGAVRLDVIDTNPRAKALYERCGFRAEGKSRLGPFRHLFGFFHATKMVRQVSSSPEQ